MVGSQVVDLRKWSPGSPDGERGASARLHLDEMNRAERLEERPVTTNAGLQEAASHYVSGLEQRFIGSCQKVEPESRSIAGYALENRRVVQVLLALPRFEDDVGHFVAELERESRDTSASAPLHRLAGCCSGHHHKRLAKRTHDLGPAEALGGSLLGKVWTALCSPQRSAQPVPSQLVIASGEHYPEDEQAWDVALVDECLQVDT